MCLPDTNPMCVMRKLIMQSELVPLVDPGVDPAGAGPYSESSQRWST